MMDVYELSAKHEIGFSIYGDICLFTNQQSLELIAACQEEGIPIFGLESYINKDGLFMLQSDNIADFSSLVTDEKDAFVRSSCHSAAAFVRQASDSVDMFEFVLADS